MSEPEGRGSDVQKKSSYLSSGSLQNAKKSTCYTTMPEKRESTENYACDFRWIFLQRAVLALGDMQQFSVIQNTKD